MTLYLPSAHSVAPDKICQGGGSFGLMYHYLELFSYVYARNMGEVVTVLDIIPTTSHYCKSCSARHLCICLLLTLDFLTSCLYISSLDCVLNCVYEFTL